MVWRSLFVAVAALLLAAHFLRWGHTVPLGASLAFPFLLLVRRRWALRAVQAALAAGALVWIAAAWRFVQHRVEVGAPWGRLALILGAVTLLTAGAALALQARSVRARYPATPRTPAPGSASGSAG